MGKRCSNGFRSNNWRSSYIRRNSNIRADCLEVGAAKRRERAAKAEKDRLQRKLTNLENNRQDIINPYEGASDLSSLAADLSGQMSKSVC